MNTRAAAGAAGLLRKVPALADLAEDQVLFIPLCARCVQNIEAMGRPTEAHDARDVVIVT